MHDAPVESSLPRRISLEYDTFTDCDHDVLDTKMLKQLAPYLAPDSKFTLELPSLLCCIIQFDERLTQLSLNRAEELLKHEPSITGMLLNAWGRGSFKEIRQLGEFPLKHMFVLLLNIA